MKTRRHTAPTKRKGKSDRTMGVRSRWAKGHSSDCNPPERKHRSVAQSHLQSALTPITLLQGQLKNTTISEIDEIGSRTLPASDAFSMASTVVTFDPFRALGRLGSFQLRKDALAILAGVSDVMKKNSSAETEVEYFAAVLSHLDMVGEDESMSGACIVLLSILLPKVPRLVLRMKFSEVTNRLHPLLGQSFRTEESEADSAQQKTEIAVQAALLSCMGSTLAAQPSERWSEEFCKNLFMRLLSLTRSEERKIRKAAKNAVSKIVLESAKPAEVPRNDETSFPASTGCGVPEKLAVEFCLRELSLAVDDPDVSDERCIYSLNLLSAFLHVVSPNLLKTALERILTRLMICTPLVGLSLLETLKTFLQKRPSESVFSRDTCSQFITALYDCDHRGKDQHHQNRSVLWAAVLQHAHVCLMDRDPKLCVEVLPVFLDFLLNLAKNAQTPHQASFIKHGIMALKSCVPSFLELNRTIESSECLSLIEACLKALLPSLTTDYMDMWPHVWTLFGAFFEAVGELCCELGTFTEVLEKLSEYRRTSVEFVGFISAIFGLAVKCVGLEPILTLLHLEANLEKPHFRASDFEKSWLLPVIRDNISANVSLKTFLLTLMPQSVKIHERISSNPNSLPESEVKQLKLLERQIWDLLPSMCKTSSDVNATAPKLAQYLGTVLLERPDLRDVILKALRALVVRELKARHGVQVSPASDDPSGPISGLAKDFLPILFNMYTSTGERASVDGCNEKDIKLATLETIKCFISIAPPGLVSQYLQFAKSEFEKSESTVERQCSILILIELMIPQLNAEGAKAVLSIVQELLLGEDARKDRHKLQKRGYRMLQESTKLNSFLAQHRTAVIDLINNADSSELPCSAKGARLHCIGCLCQSSDDEIIKQFTASAIGEISKSFTSVSKRERKAAAQTLIMVCDSMVCGEEGSADQGSVISQVISMFEPENWKNAKNDRADGNIACTRFLLFQYKNVIPPSLVVVIVGHLCETLSSPKRKVVEGALQCLSTIVGAFNTMTVSQCLHLIVPAIWTQTRDCQHHFRFLSRKLLFKLCKRYGAEPLKKWVPQEHHKLLNNVRKYIARESRKKGLKGDLEKDETTIDDELASLPSMLTDMSAFCKNSQIFSELLEPGEDSDEDELEVMRSNARKSKKVSMSLQEPSNDEALDLLDFNATAKHLHSMSRKDGSDMKKEDKKDDSGFKVDSKGRLLIFEDQTNESAEVATKRKRSSDSCSVDPSEKKTKTDFEDVDSDLDDMDDKVKRASSYKSGGHGIHRRLNGPPETKTQGANLRKNSMKKGGKKEKSKSGQKYEPYAYLPLLKETLNRRKKAKHQGQFSSILSKKKGKATKGGGRGAKKVA